MKREDLMPSSLEGVIREKIPADLAEAYAYFSVLRRRDEKGGGVTTRRGLAAKCEEAKYEELLQYEEAAS
jgi:hypothetical protein